MNSTCLRSNFTLKIYGIYSLLYVICFGPQITRRPFLSPLNFSLPSSFSPTRAPSPWNSRPRKLQRCHRPHLSDFSRHHGPNWQELIRIFGSGHGHFVRLPRLWRNDWSHAPQKQQRQRRTKPPECQRPSEFLVFARVSRESWLASWALVECVTPAVMPRELVRVQHLNIPTHPCRLDLCVVR